LPTRVNGRSTRAADSPFESGDLPIAIVGAGFSGTLLAVNLLRLGQRIALIEREPSKLAKGQAFATRRPEHLLNVRAANMSAFPDDPRHFVRWMGYSTADQTNRFVPRLAYGQYLLEQLVDALAAAPGLGTVVSAEVTGATVGDKSVILRTSGEEIACSQAVLAQGNFPPAPVPGLEHVPTECMIADPWDQAALRDAAGLDRVVLIGTGLTAIDAILSLEDQGFSGQIIAISRRGLTPRRHADDGPQVTPQAMPQTRGSRLLADIRRRGGEVGWRTAIDELRPHTQHLWRVHSVPEQARFLRHARAYWDVHRHRLAPAAADRIAALEQSGALTVMAGRIVAAEASDGRVSLTIRRRGEAVTDTFLADRIVNCTGPRSDLLSGAAGLLGDLIASGHVRPDPHRVGIDVDHLGRVRDRRGRPSDRLFAVGPITKSEAWEIVAVPDIRRQVWDLARYLANAHWTGGEGL
jgi:uncharacterized NAD(P)/FAD-binding protein YdhS